MWSRRDSETDSQKSSGQDDDSEDKPSSSFAFPDLDQSIRNAILEYDSVFPKLNWSSPKASNPNELYEIHSLIYA